jgi:hypothetical protein
MVIDCVMGLMVWVFPLILGAGFFRYRRLSIRHRSSMRFEMWCEYRVWRMRMRR